MQSKEDGKHHCKACLDDGNWVKKTIMDISRCLKVIMFWVGQILSYKTHLQV
jgi:hypothetical protein